MDEIFPRPLDERERAVLNHLLAGDFPGSAELRRQAESAVVTGKCPCGCATIDLAVDASAAPAHVERNVPVESLSREADPPFEILLFVENGRLSSLEIVTYADEPIRSFPPPAALHPAWWDAESYHEDGDS